MEKEQCFQQVFLIIDTYVYFKHNYAITVADIANHNIDCDSILFKNLLVFYKINIPELSNFIIEKHYFSDPQMDLYKIISMGKNHREPSKTHIDSLIEFILEKRHDKYAKQIGLDNTFISTMDYFNLMQKIHQLKNRIDQRQYFEKRGITNEKVTLDDIIELNIDNPYLYNKEKAEEIINKCTIAELMGFTFQEISELRISRSDFLQNMQNICFLYNNFDTLFKFSNELIRIFDELLQHDFHSLQKIEESRQTQYSPLSKSRKVHSEAIGYSKLLEIEFIYDYEVDDSIKNACHNQILSKEFDDHVINLIFYINLLHSIHWDITKLFLLENAHNFIDADGVTQKKLIEKFIISSE